MVTLVKTEELNVHYAARILFNDGNILELYCVADNDITARRFMEGYLTKLKFRPYKSLTLKRM